MEENGSMELENNLEEEISKWRLKMRNLSFDYIENWSQNSFSAVGYFSQMKEKFLKIDFSNTEMNHKEIELGF